MIYTAKHSIHGKTCFYVDGHKLNYIQNQIPKKVNEKTSKDQKINETYKEEWVAATVRRMRRNGFRLRCGGGGGMGCGGEI